MQMNRVVIAGCVSKKPAVRHLPSGTPVANVRVGEVRRTDGSKLQTVHEIVVSQCHLIGARSAREQSGGIGRRNRRGELIIEHRRRGGK